MKIFHFIISLILIVGSFISCTDDRCNLDTESLLQTEMLVSDESLTAIYYLDSMSVYSPEWPDSIHYWEGGGSNSFYLMLSPESDTTEFIFSSLNALLNDTLYIIYQREFVLVSPECGFVPNYTIDTAFSTNNYIDSIKTPKKVITANENGHIQIYF